jgi:hypothetical protein
MKSSTGCPAPVRLLGRDQPCANRVLTAAPDHAQPPAAAVRSPPYHRAVEQPEPSTGARAPVQPSRPALLCITPSPAIDRTAHVGRIVHGEILRPIELVALPGGKGVNAARAAARLGGRVMTTGIAGGHAGRWIVDALAAEGPALGPGRG